VSALRLRNERGRWEHLSRPLSKTERRKAE
jgi:hypothetical protein